MIGFLGKGLLRDRSRSFFPVLTAAFGVFLIIFLKAYFDGALLNMHNTTARHNTGHVKIMTQAYAAESGQSPNDLALMDTEELLQKLRAEYPGLIWTPRINFGGLIDIPDAHGETRVQGPAVGLALDLLGADTPEINFLNLEKAVIRGRLPQKPGEILLAEEFAERLQVSPNDTITLISSTMYGSMAVNNFTLCGTVRFGIAAMDKGALIADIRGIQNALDMQDAAGMILGFFADDNYSDAKAAALKTEFNARYQTADEFSPTMRTLIEDSGLGGLFAMSGGTMTVIYIFFVAVMALVLWNAGLISGIRRYGEMGIRLAIGESKVHLYVSLLGEAMLIGFCGSLIGTVFGLLLSYWLQKYGLNYGAIFKNSTIMIENVVRARVTPVCYFIGFVPGMLATLTGSALAGLGIFKRQTAQLFKELET